MENDAVSHIVDQWKRERPDLDASPMLVVGRLFRLTGDLDRRLRPPFAEAGLGNGDFDVLAALRRAEEPHTLTPGELSHAILVTTGAITKRIDRLEAQNLVSRTVDETDGRGRHVTLTEEGLALTDRLIAVHLENQRRLISSLSEDQRSQLADLLATLAAGLPEVETLKSQDT